jgi:hypothetical protein
MPGLFLCVKKSAVRNGSDSDGANEMRAATRPIVFAAVESSNGITAKSTANALRLSAMPVEHTTAKKTLWPASDRLRPPGHIP